jgi:hypothetical protein
MYHESLECIDLFEILHPLFSHVIIHVIIHRTISLP